MQLRDLVNQSLARIHSDGRYNKILSSYLGNVSPK
jgi:ABC-type amino acid transport substrate-binding protein